MIHRNNTKVAQGRNVPLILPEPRSPSPTLPVQIDDWLPSKLKNKSLFSEIEVFDFKAKWDVIKPHLTNKKVKAALARGMNSYLDFRRDICIRSGLNPRLLDVTYDARSGPWTYVTTDYWLMRADELAEKAGFVWKETEDADEEQREWDRYARFCDQFYPKRGTHEWYQLSHGSHWLAPWLRELGRLVYPQYQWHLLVGDVGPDYSENHSLAYGIEPSGNIKIIFDILHFETMSAKQLIESAGGIEGRFPFKK